MGLTERVKEQMAAGAARSARLTCAQAASLIGVNTSRVRQLAIAGTLKGYNIETGRGPVWHFADKDVKAYIAKRPNKWTRMDATKAPAKRRMPK